MGKVAARVASCSVFSIIFMLAGKVASRHLHYDASKMVLDELSDGVSKDEESVLRFKGMVSSETQCEQMYGFLPCSSNLAGNLFLILAYEYLLYHGEYYAGGDGQIFRVFGKNYFVSSFFQLLDFLPESAILLASGLLSSSEKAQEYIVTGVGLLAGSSILFLTVLWGICLICGRRRFYVKPNLVDNKQENTKLHANHGSEEEKRHWLQVLTGSGVNTDSETSHQAKIMLFSVIPFVIILTPWVFGESYSSEDYNIIVVSSLMIAVICLFCYFFYQSVDKKLQERRLDYAELERMVEMNVPFFEVQELMKKRDKHLLHRQLALEKKLIPPTKNDDMMKRDAFLDKFNDWLDSTRHSMDDPYLEESEAEFNQVAQLLRKEKIKYLKLISRMMGGKRDESSINKFFDKVDSNKDSLISQAELKDFIISEHEDMLIDDIADEVAAMIMIDLDMDGNGEVDREEFKSGIAKWLKEIERYIKVSHDENNKEEYKSAKAKAKMDGMFKAIALLIAGILVLTFLAEPLIQSVRIVSESVKIAPFYISFILVPLATNARTMIAAVRAAQHKRHHTTSLTFSEIYHKVFMNNVLGFSVLVSVIHFRGLTWHFSAEVLVLVIVCIVMGILGSCTSKFPSWTLFIAFPLYPLSLFLVYCVDDTFMDP